VGLNDLILVFAVDREREGAKPLRGTAELLLESHLGEESEHDAV
jgi:hypothetical protein